MLGRFTAIDLIADLPEIPVRDSELQEARRKSNMFISDVNIPTNLHTTPTHLGTFEGYASVHFQTSDLDRIASLPNEPIWAAFCNSFGISKNRCGRWQGSTFLRNIDRMGGWLTTPLELVDVRFPRMNALDEIEDATRALRFFKSERDPEIKRDRLRQLFATSHPLQVAQALIDLAGPENISRNVQLGTNPKGNGPDSAKNLFRKINGKRFHRGPRTPPPARYDTTQDIESKFNQANLTFYGVKPRLKKISLFRQASSQAAVLSGEIPHLAIKVYASRLEEASETRIYLRLEQTGKVQLAKFKLAEQVFEIPVGQASFDFEAGTSNYLIRVTGPQAVVSSLLLSEAISLGGNFRATLAISTNGSLWSDERHVDFRISDGMLLPAL
jgi:hypothetical protein